MKMKDCNWMCGLIGVAGGIVIGVVASKALSTPPKPVVTSAGARIPSMGAYMLDMRMKTYPMYPVGAGSLWNVWPGRKLSVRDGEGVYPDDGVWNREAGTHRKRY